MIKIKICSICNDEKELSEFYSQNKTKKDGTEYVYYHPECKNCGIKKAKVWQIENKERKNASNAKYMKSAVGRGVRRKYQKRYRKEGRQIEWQRENKDVVKEYNRDRRQNKHHDITDEEWFECLDYFNNCCAYCELSEKEQYELYNEQFHKEHVMHDGNNYIDNCVPSCTSCNTSKHTSEFNDWYNEYNPNFTEERLSKIVKWMMEDCFKTLNLI